ncbi:META domain-containing protein [Owenweeksia hongkongensis]|uniref:META domain-containing protein n=1 Tax=Owenweeksia hongkongensis TaxID=253245 RepID=UPI003A923C98
MKQFFFALTTLFAFSANSQILKPGFDREEYMELMLISAQTTADSEYSENFIKPENYNIMFRSEPTAMDNLWDLWVHNEGNSAVISVRGTTPKAESWLLNFYAAMVPAQGQIKWGEDKIFDYQLADDQRAAVHIGWLIGTATLSDDILQKVDYLYKEGVKNFFIIGHSQGGGIAYLLTSHFLSLQKQGKLANDIQFKTYCSAAPKPGNLYYAYEYEAKTQNGWAFNVVNAADWVPEVPITIQTLDDFNETNPFIHADEIISKQKLTTKIVLKHVYKKLNKPTRKAQKNYQRYLGDEAHKMVMEKMDALVVPDYLPSSNYVRTGIQIVLQPNNAYFQAFPFDSTAIFTHHVHKPYLYLAEKMGTPFYQKEEINPMDSEWNLVSFSGAESENWDFETYQPTLLFDINEGRISGSTGCNRYSGAAEYDGKSFKIAKEMVMTKRACRGVNEQAFIDTLTKADSYLISNEGNSLMLLEGDTIIMRFGKNN